MFSDRDKYSHRWTREGFRKSAAIGGRGGQVNYFAAAVAFEGLDESIALKATVELSITARSVHSSAPFNLPLGKRTRPNPAAQGHEAHAAKAVQPFIGQARRVDSFNHPVLITSCTPTARGSHARYKQPLPKVQSL